MSKRKDVLGKGIRALLADIDEEVELTRFSPTEDDSIINTVARIPLEQIEVNPFQPRADFNETALNELAQSISVHGVIQPITVRKIGPKNTSSLPGNVDSGHPKWPVKMIFLPTCALPTTRSRWK